MIKVINISKEYKQKDKSIHALSGVSLCVPNCVIAVVQGQSGSGKSTLLKLIGLIEKPDFGQILIDGVDYWSKKDKDRAFVRNKVFGFVYQDFNLEEKYTVYENLELPLIIAGIDKKLRRQMILDTLSKVNFEGREDSFPKDLSGGEQQRVAIARAIINNPKIILADEPCGNLDKLNANLIYELLTSLGGEKTVIIVSHSPELVQKQDMMIRLCCGAVDEIT